MEEFAYKLATIIVVLVVLVVVFIVIPPRLAENINTSKAYNEAPKTLFSFQQKAKEFKDSCSVWPTNPSQIDSRLQSFNQSDSLFRFGNSFWAYSLEQKMDTLYISATIVDSVRYHGKPLKKQYIGEFIREDSWGNRYYSHDEFKDMFESYLKDAKKVERK